MSQKKAIIIGAGPAGLTAAYELLIKSDVIPIILEKSDEIGGISRTINYKGNRIDIGGHRFFSKSDRVMNWWNNIMPIQGSHAKDELQKQITYQNKQTTINLSPNGPDPEKVNNVMLIRNRLSRIFYLRKFFDYPISLNKATIMNLGFVRIIRIGISYMKVRIFPVKEVNNLEQFFISRFGKELYLTFFKDYTEKVWGTKCSDISAEWGAQRIKKLSIGRALWHAIKSSVKKKDNSIEQKNVDTSLIESFLYPKHGPGQMWEIVADIIQAKGGQLIQNANVDKIHFTNGQVKAVSFTNAKTGVSSKVEGDYFFSTMPIVELINCMDTTVPEHVKRIANGLEYRDFITVGLLLNKLKIKNETNIRTLDNLVPDNWIYIQEKDVKVGRLQIFNNWSPYMVADISKVWIGLEYFCNEGDELWSKPDDEFVKFAIDELDMIDIIDKNEVIDSTIIRVPKTYPAYFGTFGEFPVIRQYVDSFENLFLIGRNGMHKYNNQDHSMLTAMVAVENIINNEKSKENIWSVNTEEDYHEEKSK